MNTQIIVGAARADVAFVKASSTAKEAKHETRTVGDVVRSRQAAAPSAPTSGEGDPFGDDFESAVEARNTAMATLERAVEELGPIPVTAQTDKKQRGVTREDGTWVDLTDAFAAIDERTHLEGAAIETTVYLNTIPRMWVRDSYYIVPSGPDAVTFLGHLWLGLRETHSAALVRWTKRTAQYLGAIVPVGTTTHPALVLLEIEWVANRKGMPQMARLDLGLVPDAGKATAIEAMRAMLRPPAVIDNMRDERAAQREELITATRAGADWKAPKPSKPPRAVDDLGQALVAAAK